MDQPIIQACYINGKTCRNGKRDDFELNPLTNEKNVCNKWVKLMGADPQTGNPIETWCCSEFAKIKLMLEQANNIRQTTASMDRNNNILFSALPDEAKQRTLLSSSSARNINQLLENNNGNDIQ